MELVSSATSVLQEQPNSHSRDSHPHFPPEDRVMTYVSVCLSDLCRIEANSEEKFTDHKIQDKASQNFLIREAFRTFWTVTEGQGFALRSQSKTNSQKHLQQDSLAGLRKKQIKTKQLTIPTAEPILG